MRARQPSKFGKYAEASACLGGLNGVCRLAFVLSFLLLRNLLFPYIAFAQATPDLLVLLRRGEDGAAPLFGLAIAVGFTALQLHWGALLLKQLAKLVRGGDKKPRPRGASLDDLDLEEISGRRSSVEGRNAAAGTEQL